ncbi:MAG: ChaN family lipoprotein [Saprospiraceae bacterium]
MLKYVLYILTSLILVHPGSAQSLSPFTLFTSQGKKVKYQKVLKNTLRQELVFFGEEHNNAIAHWLQLRLTKDCAMSRPLVLGAEMIERDNQDELEEYLEGEISANQLDSSARLWPNYKTDYAPLVDFAKTHGFPFIGTNIPRRFAAMVSRKGLESLDTLSVEEKSWIAPLPILYDAELTGYKNILNMMPGHFSPNLPKAQAIKDATMAHFILVNMNTSSLFIHFNGSYHSEHDQGIIWYIKKANPNIRYLTITTVTQKQIKSLDKENFGKADYILCVDEDMTTTY